MPRRLHDRLSRPASVAVLLFAALALALLLAAVRPLESLERGVFDGWLRLRARLDLAPPLDEHLVVVGIDDRALARWADLEAEYAGVGSVIGAALDLGAAVVAFDALLVRRPATSDDTLVAALERGGERMVLAEARRKPSVGHGTLARKSDPARPALPEAWRGFVNVELDPDGTLRRYHYVQPDERREPRPSLALAAYLAWRGVPVGSLQVRTDEIRWEELSEDATALEQRSLDVGGRLLDYRRPWREERFLYLAALDLLHRADDFRAGDRPTADRSLAGAVVFVSYVATSVGDQGPTPLGHIQPWVLAHVTALNDLVQGTGHVRAPAWLDALALFATMLLFLVLWPRLTGTRRMLFVWTGGTLLLTLAGASLAFSGPRLVLPTVTLAVTWTTLTAVGLARRHADSVLERERTRSVMSLYFSPGVLEDVLDAEDRLEPQEPEIAVLLTDLRNFTTISERFGARATFDMLNRAFAAQTRVVTRHEGSLEKFMGDQLLAYWGAPRPQADAPRRALDAALELVRDLDAVRHELPPPIAELFGFGAALHWGRGLVGNVGSAEHLHYGLVGDLVNSAARMEALTKRYGVTLIVSREFLETVKDPPPHRLLDRVVLKGKEEVVELFEVATVHSHPEFADLAHRYEAGLEPYLAGRFEEAEASFSELVRAFDDPASRLLAERCLELGRRPDLVWDGAYRMASK